MPEYSMSREQQQRDTSSSTTPPKTNAGGATFSQRKEDIFQRLQQSATQCRLNYSGRNELASEADETVAELCEALEDAVDYGLRQQQPTMGVTPFRNMFQNMQEIVTGHTGSSSADDASFWDFCQLQLTPHERQRYLQLKHVWTKFGRGRAFLRATLNEHSLQRYLLTWLSDAAQLTAYYTPWSLLLDAQKSAELVKIIGSLDAVLFALNIDTTELNAASARRGNGGATSSSYTMSQHKEEPLIRAPTPLPLATSKKQPIVRHIATTSSTEDLLQAVSLSAAAAPIKTPQSYAELSAACEQEALHLPPPDPIEPELAFLKQPFPDIFPVATTQDADTNGVVTADGDDKSDTSSQYSKSSSALSSAVTHVNCMQNNAALEQKLQDVSERCALLETRVAQLSLENNQLKRRLTQYFNESGIDPSSSLTANFLITIPLVKLLSGKSGASSSYYSYELHVTMRRNLEHWVLQRRYSEFYKLHKNMLKTHPSVASVVDFPPKKHFGNKNLMFVEERRQQLQIYLLNLVEMLPQVEACKTKVELQKAFPFFRER